MNHWPVFIAALQSCVVSYWFSSWILSAVSNISPCPIDPFRELNWPMLCPFCNYIKCDDFGVLMHGLLI